MPLDDAHVGYLTGHHRGRLATVAPSGNPQNKPVGYRYNALLGTIDIAGIDMEHSAKYRGGPIGTTWMAGLADGRGADSHHHPY